MRSLTHLERLEARCNHIFREVVAEAVNAVMLYSVEKDRSVMLPVARKAFYPGPPPFPMFHVASGSDFADLLATGSEWQGRTINKGLSSSLEDKNQEGYF
jgi:sulfate adenylyltransferase subunit 2